MSIRSNHLGRLLTGAAAAAIVTAAGLALPAEARADDLPAPTVRKNRPVATRTAPRRTTTRSTTRSSMRSTSVPATRATSVRSTAVPAPRATSVPVSRQPQGAISAPTAWKTGKRHSTYVPPAQGTSAPTRVAKAPSRAAAAPKTAYTFRRAPAPIASPRRAPSSHGQPARSRPARSQPAMGSQALGSPDIRRRSPSYADLRRTQPNHVASRSRAATSTSLKRRGLQRRSTATRRGHTGRSTSVPAAPGEQVQPQPSTIRQLPLKPRPGCCGDG